MFKTTRYCFLIAVVTLLLTTSAFATTEPMEKVKLTVNRVMEILTTPDLDQALKRQQLSSTIRNAFDFHSMAQRILARKWKKTSVQERERFTQLLAQLLEKNYLNNIENYTDEKVEFVKQRIKNNSAAIDTLILTKNKEIPVSYRLIQNGEEWKVYDVVIESVSFVNNYRSSYGQIIKKSGITGLLAKMEEKLAQLQQENQEQ